MIFVDQCRATLDEPRLEAESSREIIITYFMVWNYSTLWLFIILEINRYTIIGFDIKKRKIQRYKYCHGSPDGYDLKRERRLDDRNTTLQILKLLDRDQRTIIMKPKTMVREDQGIKLA